jgi:hypothetical protein
MAANNGQLLVRYRRMLIAQSNIRVHCPGLLIPRLLVVGTVAERVSFYAVSVYLPKPRGYSKQADVTLTVAFFTRNTTRAIFLPHTTHPYRHLRHPTLHPTGM